MLNDHSEIVFPRKLIKSLAHMAEDICHIKKDLMDFFSEKR